jgi:hypothetical protein
MMSRMPLLIVPLIAGATLIFGPCSHVLADPAKDAPRSKAPTSPPPPPAQSPSSTDQSKPSFCRDLQVEAAGLVSGLGTEPVKQLLPRANALWELAIRYADTRTDSDGLVEACASQRLMAALDRAKDSVKPGTLRFLASNPILARTLALTLRNEDDAEGVFEVLGRLCQTDPKNTADSAGLSSLVAAVCVVFDKPPMRMPQTAEELKEWSEGAFAAAPADAVEVFGYFAKNRSSMMFAPDKAPPQALIYVVDTPCTPTELEWALKQHHNNPMVGKLYDRVRYDTQHFKFNKPKKIASTSGYTLENISKVGGVCAEQAYFATNVGKAIGVPTVIVRVQGPTQAHAYVGYVRTAGSNTAWNFDEGRYDEYEKIRGSINDPQTGRVLHDGQVALTAGVMLDSREDRESAIALTDAAEYAMKRGRGGTAAASTKTGVKLDAKAPEGRAARTLDDVAAEALLREAVERCPHYAQAWEAIVALVRAGELDDKRVKEWREAVMRLCNTPPNTNPDFAFDVLAGMFSAVKDPKAQSALWDWTAERFSQRVDLAGSARLKQASLWTQNDQPGRAWGIYQQIISSSRNEGTLLVDALSAAERLLRDEGKPEESAITLYETAMRRIGKPQKVSAEFAGASNYYRVGARLAELYEKSGRPNDVQRVRRMIDWQEEQ